MRHHRFTYIAPLLLTLGLLPACASSDTAAANYAADAQVALDQGRIPDAMIAIKKAIGERDDVVEYWLLMAHIDLKADDRPGAFSAYQYVIQLDHSNTEALQALCQLAITSGDPNQVDKYADELLLLTPGAPAPLTAKGSAALMRGDTATASSFAEQVLAQDPQNIGALILKARVMIAGGQFADAAALVEKAPDSPTNILAKLQFLKQLYVQAHDRAGYELTVKQLADAVPGNPDAQFAYADLLYQHDQNDLARSVVRKVILANQTNFQIASAVLALWMKAGPQALDAGRIVGDASGLSLLMKADYAQFANEIGRPDLAMAILHGVDQGDPTADNADAKAAYAYALGLQGQMPEAIAQLDAILGDDQDPNQPRALLARARLRARQHDYVPAIADARLAVANDPKNPTARLALADILQASGAADLSASALREGLRAMPDDVRIANRLAAMLTAHGQPGQAASVARDLIRTAAMDLRAQHLSDQYGGANTPTSAS